MATYVLNDHDQEGELDAKCFLGVCRARNVCGAHVGACNFQHAGLNVGIGDALDVTIADCVV